MARQSAEALLSGDKKRLLASIRAEDGVAKHVLFSGERTRTAIGPQGDHTSAHALFHECVTAACEGKDLVVACALTLQIIDHYTENSLSQDIYDHAKKALQDPRLHSEEQIGEITATLAAAGKTQLAETVGPALREANQSVYTQLLGHIVEAHTVLRNKLDAVSFPREGNAPPKDTEGMQIKGALKGLREITSRDISQADHKEIVKHMKDLLHYPKIPATVLIDIETPAGQAKWDGIKGRYNAGTLPRNNDPEMLATVLANHMQLVTSCFPGLEGEQVKEIKEMFVAEFAKSWNMPVTEVTALQAAVTAELPKYLQDFVQSASAERTPPSGRSRSASSHSAERSDGSGAAESMLSDEGTAALLTQMPDVPDDMELDEREHPSHVATVLADPTHAEHNYLLDKLIARDILAHPNDDDFGAFKEHMRKVFDTPGHLDQGAIAGYKNAVDENRSHPYHNRTNDIAKNAEMHDIGSSMRRSSRQQRETGL
jgi:hypothetical protein